MHDKWEENKAIGNQAESIVEFMINSTSNWRCIKFGVENHINELKTSLKGNHKNEISKRIRSMPDIVAVNNETKDILLIDVKYRSYVNKKKDGSLIFSFGYNKIKDYLEYWDRVHLVIVHNKEPYFFVVDLKDVVKENHFQRIARVRGVLWEMWNFADIKKEVKAILPEISEETLKKAVAMIPSKR